MSDEYQEVMARFEKVRDSMNESVHKWLEEFSADPTIIQKVILGYSGVTAWSGSSLGEVFREIHEYKPDDLDSSLVWWLGDAIKSLYPVTIYMPCTIPRVIDHDASMLRKEGIILDFLAAVKYLRLPKLFAYMRENRRRISDWISNRDCKFTPLAIFQDIVCSEVHPVQHLLRPFEDIS